MLDKTPDGEEFENAFLYEEEFIQKVAQRWFSCAHHNYSDVYKEGFYFAFRTGFKMHEEVKRCPHPEPSIEAEAWWSGYGQACTWLLCRAQDDDQYWNWSVYTQLRKMAPKLDPPFDLPHKFPSQLVKESEMSTGNSAKCDNCNKVHSNTDTDMQIQCYPGGMQIGFVDSDGELDTCKDICEDCAGLVKKALKNLTIPASRGENGKF